MERYDLIEELKSLGYNENRGGKGSHTIFTNKAGYSVSIPKGKEIAIGTAKSILKQAEENSESENDSLKTTNTSTSTNAPIKKKKQGKK